MASYTSNLKSWGATGQEFPDNYSYIEDEAPVDDWDNFTTHNLISDVRSHLIPLTNSRIESDSGTTRPSSPEDGHVFYDSDTPVLEQYRATDSSWHALALNEDLDAHVSDTTNPHSVTYTQANAIQDADATVTEAHLAFATATQSELDSHTSDTTNPHAVTYAQANAIQDATSTVDESHLSFDTATQTELDSHVTDTNNPHSVGLEQARTQNPTLSGDVDFGSNNLLGVSRAEFNSGDVRVGHTARELLVEEYDGSAWTTRLSVDEIGASVTGAFSVSSTLSVSGATTFGANASLGGNNALGVGLIEFSDSDGDTNQWTATEDATSGNLEVRSAGTPVLDVGSNIIDVLGSLRESGDRVATRTWTNNNADVPNADYADNAGDADTVDGKHAADLGVTVEDGTTVIYDPATGINFGTNLSVTDDGDGTVTVDSLSSSDTHTGVSEDGTQTLSSVDDIDFLGHLNVLDQGDGTVTVDPVHNHDNRYVDQSGDTMSGGLTIGGDLTATNGETVWDESATYIPQGRLQNDTVTVAGNAVSLGSSVSVSHGDLFDAPASAHHSRYSDEEAQDAVGAMADATLAYSDSTPSLGVANGSIGTGKLSFDPATQTELNSHTSNTQGVHQNTTVTSSDITTSGETSIISSGGTYRDYSSPSLLAEVSASVYDGITVANDGKNVFAHENDSRIHKYPISTAYDLSSAGSRSQYTDLAYSVRDVRFNGDGTSMWIIDGNQVVREYSLSTAYDLSTLTETSTTFQTDATADPGFDIGPNGTYMYVSAYGQKVWEYQMSTAYDVSTASLNSSIDAGYQQGNSVSVFDDGSALMVNGNYNPEVYTMSTAFDITTTPDFGNRLFDSNYGSGVHVYDTYVYWTDSVDNFWYQHDVANIVDVSLSSSDTVNGNEITVKQNDEISVNVEATGTIDGSSSYKLDSTGSSVRLTSDGTDWYTI